MRPSLGEVRARWLSGEVLDLAAAGPVAGSVTARFGATLHAEVEGFVIAVLPPGAPRMPNGLSVRVRAAGGGAEIGDPVLLRDGELVAGRLVIGWDPDRSPRWDATVPRWTPAQREGLGERAEAILASCVSGVAGDVPAEALAGIHGFSRDDRGAREGLAFLLAAVRTENPRLAARAGRQLVGRGPGLTPLGDDILAATALTVGSVGAAAGFISGRRRAWLRALAPPGLRKRTTSVSATMLELAIRGRGMGPVQALLDPGPTHGRRLADQVDRLRGLGHTTGPAYAAAIGAVALVLAPPKGRPNPPTKEQIR